MPTSINEYHKIIVLKLKALFPHEEARAMADTIFRYFFQLSPVQRVMAGSTKVDKDKILLVDDAINKLMRNNPLQYVLGSTFFMEMEFRVNPDVLIPRPETEELVSLILKYYADKGTDKNLHILDIGTGSGCIAIALKSYLPDSVISAMDISYEALKVAAENAKNNNIEINFIHADILDNSHWNSLPQVDLIVSNPPYVTQNEKKHMKRNVLDHEPHSALFVSDADPLIFYRQILALSKIKLSVEGSLWFEINEMFGDELKVMALNQGFKEANIIFDIRGKSRFLQCLK